MDCPESGISLNPERESTWKSIIGYHSGLAALLTVTIFNCGTVIPPSSSYERKGLEKLFFFFRSGSSGG